MKIKDIRIMSHMVAGFPDMEESYKIAESLINSGTSILEVQFPFSDPTADGKYIEMACTGAIKNGFKVNRGFDLVKNIYKNYAESKNVPIFIMSYANIPFNCGIEKFLKKAKESGVKGVIVPDLPFDYDEGIFKIGRAKNINIIPVITPSISEDRLNKILSIRPEYIYTTLRKGITGDSTKITDETIGYLKMLNTSGCKILAGFGLSSGKQIKPIKDYIYAAVIGSTFIKAIESNKNVPPHKAVEITLKKIIEES